MANPIISINVLGLKEAEDMLKNIGADLPHALREATMKAGLHVEKEVKQSISGRRDEPESVDTGLFRSSVKTIETAPFEVKVLSDVEYAKYLEWGTHNPKGGWKIAPRRHFTNTLHNNQKTIRDILAVEVGIAVRKYQMNRLKSFFSPSKFFKTL